jgi:hypothetical protein
MMVAIAHIPPRRESGMTDERDKPGVNRAPEPNPEPEPDRQAENWARIGRPDEDDGHADEQEEANGR